MFLTDEMNKLAAPMKNPDNKTTFFVLQTGLLQIFPSTLSGCFSNIITFV
jgi:hypothetical protein